MKVQASCGLRINNLDDHGDETHDDHGDEEGHDDHGDEEALAYDPHSWLDPLAYKAQVALVLGEMKTVFPDLLTHSSQC